MTETALTNEEALALSGTTDSDTDFRHHAVGESTYYHEGYRQRHRVLTVLKLPNRLRVYKDGALSFGVRSGVIADGDAVYAFAGVSAQPLTNGQTNYIYLRIVGAAATLTVNTTGFPSPSATPHVPLATIAPAGGGYAADDIVDCRGRSALRLLDAMTAANANALVGGSAVTLHTHAAAGLDAAVQDRMPDLALSGGAEAGDVIRVTVQARDAAGNALAERVLVRLWLAGSALGAPSATGNSVSVVTGTTYAVEVANAAYKIISDAAGVVAVDIAVSGAATRHVMAEIDGRIYTSGAIAWAA